MVASSAAAGALARAACCSEVEAPRGMAAGAERQVWMCLGICFSGVRTRLGSRWTVTFWAVTLYLCPPPITLAASAIVLPGSTVRVTRLQLRNGICHTMLPSSTRRSTFSSRWAASAEHRNCMGKLMSDIPVDSLCQACLMWARHASRLLHMASHCWAPMPIACTDAWAACAPCPLCVVQLGRLVHASMRHW